MKQKNKNKTSFYKFSNKLKIIPLGGTTTVQKNMYVYEYGNDIIVMDCGIGFPDGETPGVDIIIPDFTYILENKEKVKGIVITHGHDDHKSALRFLLKEHKFPVYAIKFVKRLIEASLEEFTDLGKVNITEIAPAQSFQLGVFRLHPYRVNHSIPDTLGFAIDTPEGRVFHNTDYKFDWTPVMDKPFDIQKAAKLANEKGQVLALLSDCLGSTSDGYADSETKLQQTFEKIMSESTDRQILFTTISSNISRIYQAIDASRKFGRKVVISGRSLRQTIAVARELKYIDFDQSIFLDERDAHSYPQNKLTYIITGCYGQKSAGLPRAAMDDHKYVHIEPKAVIIFSADPIPNSVSQVNRLIDELYRLDTEIYYSEIQDNLHVSGHGLKGDMTLLANIVKPKYFIPIGGNIKHMRAYAELMQGLGNDPKNIFQLLDGQSVEISNSEARIGKRYNLREIYVDGNLVGDVGTAVLSERMQMSNHGMVVVVISRDRVEVITRGFVFVKGSQKLIKDAKELVRKKLKAKTEVRKLERDLLNYFKKETGREPLVMVAIL